MKDKLMSMLARQIILTGTGMCIIMGKRIFILAMVGAVMLSTICFD